MGWNLPPGCSVTDIPGNRPEDVAFEKFLEDRGQKLVLEFYEEQSEKSVWIAYDEDKAFRDFVDEKFEEVYFRRKTEMEEER